MAGDWLKVEHATLDKMADGNDWWSDIKRVGTAAADSVADCFAEFWKDHPEYCGD